AILLTPVMSSSIIFSYNYYLYNVVYSYHFTSFYFFFFFFNDTATTEIYTLSLHDALPISLTNRSMNGSEMCSSSTRVTPEGRGRSEEHTSELQSPYDLVCRLLLEKKKKKKKKKQIHQLQYITYK